jgi:hypothetical protein
MDPLTAATETAPAVSQVASHFMLAGDTYKRGAELGFTGLDFYFAGRGGVLGDVDGDTVAAAFTFFEPSHVRTQWELGRKVMAPADAAKAFAGCLDTWAAANVGDDLDAGRLASLASRIVAAADPAAAPVFAGWTATIPVPTDPKLAAAHHMNALRELRAGLHGTAVLASGLTPQQAVSHRTPHMLPLFGWPGPADTTGVPAAWDGAERATDEAISQAYTALEGSELGEFVELATQLHATCQ